MQIKSTLVRLVGASLIAIGVVPLIGGTSSANTTGTATNAKTDTSAAQCVAPGRSVFSFARLSATTYQVSLKDPATVTCTAVTFNVASWTVPETWDRKGFNQTALPQVEFDYAALTFPAGGKEPVTATVKVPSCDPFQTDIYAGARRPSPLVWPNPLGADRILGTIRDQAPCVTPTPTPSVTTPTVTTPTPTVTTPTVTTPTPSVTETPNTVTTSPAVAPVTSATRTPTDTPSVLGIKISKTVTPVQVSRVPSGGVQAGGGSTAGLQHVQLLALGGSLLLAGAIGLLFRRRLAQGAARSPR
jgi:hypothetical protein